MADSQTAPLTDEERAELEELRAEKARREEEERARRERAELEALRAEKVAAEAPAAAAPVSARQSAPTPRRAPKPEAAGSVSEPAEKTFGQRMVTTDVTDEDGIPAMPPAQKIILAVCALLVLAFVIWNFVK